MILLLFCLIVPAALFTWRLCVVAGESDDRMAAAFQQMIREKEGGSQVAGDDLPAKEDANAG
jgi:hypothetical protein